MKRIWYHISPKCSDTWENEASREYIERPVHLIREQDKQCMSCCKSLPDAKQWVKEYAARMGSDWQVLDINQENKKVLDNFFGKLF